MLQLNVKVNVFRIIKTADTLGGWTEVRNVLHNNLPCRINWKRGNEKIFFAKNTYLRDAKMFCRIVDISVEDEVQYNGKTYEVVDVANVDVFDRYMSVDLKLIE